MNEPQHVAAERLTLFFAINEAAHELLIRPLQSQEMQHVVNSSTWNVPTGFAAAYTTVFNSTGLPFFFLVPENQCLLLTWIGFNAFTEPSTAATALYFAWPDLGIVRLGRATDPQNPVIATPNFTPETARTLSASMFNHPLSKVWAANSLPLFEWDTQSAAIPGGTMTAITTFNMWLLPMRFFGALSTMNTVFNLDTTGG